MANYFYTDGNGQKQGTITGLLALALVMLSLGAVVGCGKSGSSALVGMWSREEGQSLRDIPADLELLKDGTGIVDTQGITWKTEGSRFYLTHPLKAEAWNYKISGSTLTLTSNDGQSTTYKKVTVQKQRDPSATTSNDGQSTTYEKVTVQKQRDPSATFTHIKMLARAVERYEVDMGQPPTTEQGLAALIDPPSDLRNPANWAGEYISRSVTNIDVWGNEIQYRSPGNNGRRFDIFSIGRDGIAGTDDDIGSWMSESDFR